MLLSNLIVRVCSCKNILDKLLRIAIDDWKPGALHLNHNSVAFQEPMVDRMQSYIVFIDLIRFYCLGLLETLSKPAAEHFVGDHQLVASHLWILLVFLRVDIDKLNYPVAVSS